MKRVYITTIVAALLVLAVFSVVYTVWEGDVYRDVLKVGFIYDNDESAPYTYNFALSAKAIEKKFGDRVKVYACSNVPDVNALEPVQELADYGCDIIFTNSYSDEIVEAARQFPDIQFCQSSYNAGSHEGNPENYHTFNATIYQGRYLTGIAAGLKLREMIDNGLIAPEEALVGYIGAFPSVEVVSGYTAFILGVRSVVPEATMRVRYTGTWSNYSKEKACTKAMIEEGCIIICQHTDTIGPAVACEEESTTHKVFHIGYNQNMIDVAPYTSLISCRVNWTPYVIGAVEAMLAGKEIEKYVPGNVHGNDISAGLELDWVDLPELNRQIAAIGTQEKLDKAAEALKKGSIEVFKGDYIGVNPDDTSDTVDLSNGYRENDKCSWPTFNYILNDIITIES